MKKLLMVTALILSPMVALADDSAILATYGTANDGENAWSNSVTIHEDGKLVVTHCKGYETEGPGCKTRKGKVTAQSVAAIRAAAVASGLAENPARKDPEPLMGAEGDWGSVFVDGVECQLWSDPIIDDANRVGAVKAAIRAAIPTRFFRFMHPG